MKPFRPENLIDIYTDKDLDVFEKIAQDVPTDMFDMEISKQELIPEKSWAYVTKLASGEWLFRYPINNPANAFISHQYLLKCAKDIPRPLLHKLLTKTSGALEQFGVKVNDKGKSLQEVIDASISNSKILKIKTAPQNFREIILDGFMDGPKGVVGAINRFKLYSYELSPLDSFKVATSIIDQAEAVGVHIPRESKLYRLRFIDRDRLNEKVAMVVVKSRLSVYKDDGLKEKALNLLEKIATAPAMDFVNELYEIDKQAGVDNKYESGVMSPFTMFIGKKTLVKISSDVGITDSQSQSMRKIFKEEFVNSFIEKVASSGLPSAISSVDGRSARMELKKIFGDKR